MIAEEFQLPVAGHIGKLLLESGKINPQQAEQILLLQKERSLRFGEAAILLGFIDEGDIQQALAAQFAYPYLLPGEGGLDPALVAAYKPFQPQVEALRSLRSQLLLRWMSVGQKCIALVEPEAGQGASLTAANLAIVFSQLGERTLLIDANLRQPRQHALFGLNNRLGLSDLLAGRADLAAIQRVDKLRDLSVLTAGTQAPNPQELLSRDGFGALLTTFQLHYDVILLDAHPAHGAADAQLIAARAHGVVLVGQQHRTSLKSLQRSRDQLNTAGAQVLGVVLTTGDRM
ncbi:chain length determinant protein tyrosine kinase EpsG [Jeongeupia chitinilytica]|uniref:Chain length determinant protein tyrosine kinase EpsG n=1 Tax=Jeongeupia chitinilytica TaxID=1041641 RepID=A0ABQ3GWW0_9NEIS|nr:chain length determinant protein tyrosine kinase EpsG [Jeongeupia chitinilytica]GHD56376.1 hypothetical protein GCM10007350_03330 [Jeongeupia chitinilytica]